MSRRKYSNVKVAGFDSRREYRRAQELELLQKLGEISNLEYQVAYEIIPQVGKQRPTRYIADFRYVEGGKTVIEDAKGMKTAVYRLKKKLMLFMHGIAIKET